MSPATLARTKNDRLLHIIFDALEVTTSLRTAATLFPEHTALEPGEMSASVTVNAFAAVLEKHLGLLLDLANGEHESQTEIGGLK